MKQLILSITFAAAAFLTLSAEDCGQTHYFISDSGFDLWCGDALCNWSVQSGEVRRAPTWHEGDYAVEMVGTDVVISQLSVKASTSCLRFEMLADIEDNARVTLSMDFYDDGKVDYSQELAHVRWESIVYFVSLPAGWQGVRFSIRKEGQGNARLAQIEATSSTECIDKPIEIVERPLGAVCGNGAQCSSGLCTGGGLFSDAHCAGCETSDDCGPEMVCGKIQLPSYLGIFGDGRDCVPPLSRQLGTRCAVNGECISGACLTGQCAECAVSLPSDSLRGRCPVGETCEEPPDMDGLHLPGLCSGDGPGTLCMQDSDCSSAMCEGGGDVRVCTNSGRDCREDDDCASTSTCVTVGIESGTCQ